MSKHHLEDDGNERESKRIKSNGPSFLPPKGDLMDVPPSTPASSAQKLSTSDEAAIAAKRAEIALKFKSMMANKGGPSAAAPASAAKPASAAAAPPMSDLQKKIAEAKKKIEAMAAQGAANPYTALGGKAKVAAAPTVPGVSLHPLLSTVSGGGGAGAGGGDAFKPVSNKDRYKPMQPKFATTSANARAILQQPVPAVKRSLEQSSAPTLEEARKNPYFDRRLGVESLAPKSRKSRPLKFAQKGKFTALAEHLRAEARQEEMRQRILEMSRKAGMDSEIDGTSRRAKKPAPPPIEWWDALFLTNETYDDVDNGVAEAIIATEDAEKGISRYVQHPIKVPAPQDNIKIDLKPLMLTPKEQKKLRRTNRAAELRDKQDRIRMGLLPPDPPKIKIGNMMRVLTQEAVMDPTKVEARVRREMMQRHDKHERDNAERKLTSEQRAAKLEQKAEADAGLGIHAAVFKIRHLQYGAHKFKVLKNAQQFKLTGCIIFNPHFVLVLVEGGEKAIKKYLHLLMDRIKWDEEEPPEHMPADQEFDDVQAQEAAVPPGENTCELVWAGMHRERMFDTLRLKSCPSDHLAREWLGPKAEGYWTMATSKAGQAGI